VRGKSVPGILRIDVSRYPFRSVIRFRLGIAQKLLG
jgi:hypothetical protein